MLSANFDLTDHEHSGCAADHNVSLLVKLAQEAEGLHQFELAETLLKRACASAREQFGPDSVSVATILWDLSVIYEQQGKLGEADEIADKMCAILAARSGSQRRMT